MSKCSEVKSNKRQSGIKEICRKSLRLPKTKEDKVEKLEDKMLVGLLLLLISAAHQTLANEVTVRSTLRS